MPVVPEPPSRGTHAMYGTRQCKTRPGIESQHFLNRPVAFQILHPNQSHFRHTSHMHGLEVAAA
ncbi:hypothetical protein BN2476_1240045 [Paraburkholderia piptadeniae]|uniref:Uncharacterized protein n=1 Tax=Paraburkholderia piptadeniae TaxID=1701573 RepID=A0A1N7SXE5_9BURK|nr:hypothetical protein BN2476_1240045 [Paraburkholderia piptadeniae]